MKKCAFTLAEILITLTIIGIIAAMTIPAVISSTKGTEFVAGVRKAYNTLKSVQRGPLQEFGDPSGWIMTNNSGADFEKYFKNHFKLAKDCPTAGDTECFESKDTVAQGGRTFVSLDGMSWSFVSNAAYKVMYADVNGKKKPNEIGRDIFVFKLDMAPSDSGMAALGFVPVGHGWSKDNINKSCESYGYACTAKVLSDGAMDYTTTGACSSPQTCIEQPQEENPDDDTESKSKELTDSRQQVENADRAVEMKPAEGAQP